MRVVHGMAFVWSFGKVNRMEDFLFGQGSIGHYRFRGEYQTVRIAYGRYPIIEL